MSNDALNLIYLIENLGEYGRVPSGAIVNIGGVAGPGFTVGGKSLMFADGTSTDGSGAGALKTDFQNVYINSTGAEAKIDFISGKDFVLEAVNNKQFRFDADTGDVTITGNLTVYGETTEIVKAAVETDRVTIIQSAGDYVPFLMEPLVGVVPVSNVVDIKIAHGGESVFSISATGETFVKNLRTGLINGIDLGELASKINTHLDNTGIKHTAKQISVDTTGLEPIVGTNVQEALESVSQIVNTLTSRDVGDVQGFEHNQITPSATWVISHNQTTKRVHMTVWDAEDEQLLPDSITIFDANTIVVRFGTPIVGRAILMLFGANKV